MTNSYRNFINRIAVILLTLTVIVCYYEFERGICNNYYRIPLFVTNSPLNILFFGILGFAVARSVLSLYPNILSVLFEREITGKNRSPILTFSLILSPVILILLSHFTGYKWAGYRSQYPVSVTNKNFVLVHKYGDYFILKDYDPSTRQLGDKVIIESSKSLKEVFIVMPTGPLINKGNYNLL